MRLFQLTTGLALAALVSACGTSGDIASRNAPYDTTIAGSHSQNMPSLRVEKVNVTVPRTLVASEANSFYPEGDIVWREDPVGDRHAQVKAIFENAMALGTSPMHGDLPVILDIQVLRFHALTEKTRYTVGGIHAITFSVALHNAVTGDVVGTPRVVRADLPEFGGAAAVAAMRRGHTQKVRITGHLANVIRTELEVPGGYRNESLGLIQVLNTF